MPGVNVPLFKKKFLEVTPSMLPNVAPIRLVDVKNKAVPASKRRRHEIMIGVGKEKQGPYHKS